MSDQSFRGFFARLEREHPHEVLAIDEPVSPKFRIQALIAELERRGRYPALRLSRVEGASMPVVANFFASRSRLALALGVPVAGLAAEVGKRSREYLQPVKVSGAPFQEVTRSGGEVDLHSLPLVTHYPVDAAPYKIGRASCRERG